MDLHSKVGIINLLFFRPNMNIFLCLISQWRPGYRRIRIEEEEISHGRYAGRPIFLSRLARRQRFLVAMTSLFVCTTSKGWIPDFNLLQPSDAHQLELVSDINVFFCFFFNFTSWHFRITTKTTYPGLAYSAFVLCLYPNKLHPNDAKTNFRNELHP